MINKKNMLFFLKFGQIADLSINENVGSQKQKNKLKSMFILSFTNRFQDVLKMKSDTPARRD
ncbi:hypothetical protein BpHYR1_044235 [Brachionus plicatilis]|uniref:Uncharacterized protein n=1 Tax=Brachionus plicatilis TaxID=10195 RepID=A0A3M7SVY3_BRAPC|nr:hypothetical protein BpHYR1_044235 [Brachionus plicatilis]